MWFIKYTKQKCYQVNKILFKRDQEWTVQNRAVLRRMKTLKHDQESSESWEFDSFTSTAGIEKSKHPEAENSLGSDLTTTLFNSSCRGSDACLWLRGLSRHAYGEHMYMQVQHTDT